MYFSYSLMEARAGVGSDLFRFARALVRAAEEKSKPNGERLREYTDSRLALLSKSLLDPQPVYPDLGKLTLGFWLSKLRENLTADARGHQDIPGQGFARKSGGAFGPIQIGRSRHVRKALWDGGMAAIQASDDPMIHFVLATDAASRAIRKQYEDEVIGPVDRASQKIAQARFAIYGTSVYPDATFSLRLTYGKIGGWTENGVTVPAFTYYSGLWERATGQFPFALTPRWPAPRTRSIRNWCSILSATMTLSAAIPARLRSMPKGMWWAPSLTAISTAWAAPSDSIGRVNRSVAVSTAAITEALRKVYNVPELVKELTAR